MWSSLKEIKFPESLAEAYRLSKQSNSVIFSDGSYLTARREYNIKSLIDINDLLPTELDLTDDKLYMGAAVPLQDIVDVCPQDDPLKLKISARYSCRSMNIRNQRTIGGELVWNRSNSELNVLVRAMNPVINFTRDEAESSFLNEWDGEGILEGVQIDISDIKSVYLERFALLESAPAFVIVAAVNFGNNLQLAVGGSTSEIIQSAISFVDFDEDWIESFIQAAGKYFYADNAGSKKYKKTIIRAGLNRIREAL